MEISIGLKFEQRERALLGEIVQNLASIAGHLRMMAEQSAETNRKFTKAIDCADNATRAVDGIRPAIEGLQLGGAIKE